MIDQNATLQFDIYDRLDKDYNYWESYLIFFANEARNYYQTSPINDEIIEWEYMNNRLFSIKINMNRNICGDGISREIDANVFRINNDAAGVQYLNKWAEFGKKVILFSNSEYCEKHLESINKWKNTTITDSETISVFCERMADIQPRAIELAALITEKIKNTLWYKQHPELIRLNSQDAVSIELTETVKSSKKENPVGWKHQLIMLDELGLLDSGKLERLNNTQKAKVLALLLKRSEQDIRVLLGSWRERKNPKVVEQKYLIKEHHEESVKDWLLDIGMLF